MRLTLIMSKIGLFYILLNGIWVLHALTGTILLNMLNQFSCLSVTGLTCSIETCSKMFLHIVVNLRVIRCLSHCVMMTAMAIVAHVLQRCCLI